MKIYIGYDHRGVKQAYKIEEYLLSCNYEVNEPFDANKEDDDYPDIAKVVCEKVKKDKGSMGILLCGTGIGMNIACNRLKGIRAVLAESEADAYFSRRHEDANVLVLACGYTDGTKTVRPKKFEPIINTFIQTPFEGDRHIRRIKKLDKMDEK